MQWEKVFNNCFLTVDDEVSGKVSRVIPVDDASVSNCASEPLAPETVGSTAVVAVVCSSHIIVANCGDSRAVLYRGKEPIALSVDHKVSFYVVMRPPCFYCILSFSCLSFGGHPRFIRCDFNFQPNREDEYARIEAAGGKVIQWNGHRVFGVLAMSRSIGTSLFIIVFYVCVNVALHHPLVFLVHMHLKSYVTFVIEKCKIWSGIVSITLTSFWKEIKSILDFLLRIPNTKTRVRLSDGSMYGRSRRVKIGQTP